VSTRARAVRAAPRTQACWEGGRSAAAGISSSAPASAASPRVALSPLPAAPRFPGVKVITSEIDKCVDEDTFAVIPGARAEGGGRAWREGGGSLGPLDRRRRGPR
jgi:hypothetical protein